jgi:Rieske Fe-S protein
MSRIPTHTVGDAPAASRPLLQDLVLRLDAPKQAWDKIEFRFPTAGCNVPGIAIRLPETAGGGIFAACAICPHQGCTFGYETDYQTISGFIGINLDHPVLFCRCHLSTFAPAEHGRVLYGPSQLPP